MSTATETQTLILAGEGYNLTIAPKAEAQKAELLKHAALIVEVGDNAASSAAMIQIKSLASMRRLVEGSRKAVKEPVLQIGKDIDEKAKNFVAAIEAEEKRLADLVAKYAQAVEAERQRILREQEAQRREQERIQREAEAARLKAEQEAEAARQKAAQAEWEEDPAVVAAAEAEAKRKADEAAAAQQAVEAAKPAPVFDLVPQAPSGVKMEWDFEVTDLHALYQHNAALVKMEPKRAEILANIKLIAIGDDAKIPGLRIFKKPAVRTH